MREKTAHTLRWMRLDNAAKIYPAARRRNWSNVFRQSVTLTEDIDIAVLKSALEVTVKRFPSMAARLRKGMFWYYLQEVAFAPEIKEEFVEKLEKYKLPKEEIKIQSEKTTKKLEKQFLTTDSGIEINIPMEEYNNKQHVEFITNQDGTISVLIKNVNRITSK